jgi:hypothetical protein
MGFYFLDIFGLSEAISPTLNREFGVLEHLQLLIILAIIVLAFRTARKTTTRFQRYFFLLAGVFSIFIFLEEVDYGIHYYEFIVADTIEENSTGAFEDGPRNLHNQGYIRQYTMWAVYLGLVIFLGLASFLRSKSFPRNAWLRWLIPSNGYFILSLVAMFLINELVRYLEQNVKDPSIISLNGNTIEFQETFIYYIAFLYLFELSRKPFGAKQYSNPQTATIT